MTEPLAPGAVLQRLKQAAGVEKDADLAVRIGVRPNVVANWRSRGRVPPAAVLKAAQRLGVSVEEVTNRQPDPMVRDHGGGYQAETDGPRPPQPVRAPPPGLDPAAGDPRLAAVLAWWTHYWMHHDPEERAWALVQFRRAIPEAGEWMRRWIEDLER